MQNNIPKNHTRNVNTGSFGSLVVNTINGTSLIGDTLFSFMISSSSVISSVAFSPLNIYGQEVQILTAGLLYVSRPSLLHAMAAIVLVH
ncbi:hypothetical protein SLA2020_359600 [Shorea laevis]